VGVTVQKLLGPFCNAWLAIVSVHNHSSSFSWTVKRTDFGKNVINLILARPRLPLGQNIDQIERM
jgi:hypothetical protein